MGGNTAVLNKYTNEQTTPTKIRLARIGRTNFTHKFIRLFKKLNNLFYAKYDKYIWDNIANLENGTQFNGSSSYIFNPSYQSSEILKFKPIIGDIDLMIPKELAKDVWHLLDELEGQDIIPGVTYMGMNRMNPDSLGDTMITVFRAYFEDVDCYAQVDLELSDTIEGNPTEWASFSHSSSFEDAKKGIKAVHHKFVIQSLIGAISLRPDIIIATPASKFGKVRLKKFKGTDTPRMLKFSVTRGVGAAYEAIMDEENKHVFIDDKKVYRETKTSEREYTKDLKQIYKMAVNAQRYSESGLSKFNSFIGVVKLMKKLNLEQLEDTHERYFNKLWGPGAQALEKDANQDFIMKTKGYDYFVKKLNLKGKYHKIDEYYKHFEDVQIKPVFHGKI